MINCARCAEKELGVVKRKAREARSLITSDPKLRSEYCKLREAHSRWLDSGDRSDLIEWKQSKRNFRQQQKECVLRRKAERCGRINYLYSMDRVNFWKFVRKERRCDSAVNLKRIDFESYYRSLYESQPNELFHENITVSVNEKAECLKNLKINSTVTLTEVKDAMGKLTLGKAVGFDGVCAELYRYGVETGLSVVITWYLDLLFSIGYIPSEFNISLITPIPKNRKHSRDPADFRPISVSSALSLIFEDVVRQKLVLELSPNQFGFRIKTSTKHAFFVVNETLLHYKNGGGQCWAAALDATKAFDRVWRDGMFHKLNGRIPDVIWRILFEYYKTSEGIVKLGDDFSRKFVIQEGVKQGGIISPMLFNFFINDLIEQCVNANIGAVIGSNNVSVIAYCDDLILLSPLKSHLRELLEICEKYAYDWKIRFNPSKSTLYCTNSVMLSEVDFSLSGGLLRKVENFEYLGLPIGSRKYVDEFYDTKFRSVEKSFFSIRRIGLHKGFLDPGCLSFVYRQFCQSIFLYGLELVHLSKGLLRHLESRQSLILKMALGLSKFSRSRPLIEAMDVSPLLELYYKFKYLFLGQVKTNRLTASVFLELRIMKPKRGISDSYLGQLGELSSILGRCPETLGKKELLVRIKSKFGCENQGLVDSVRSALETPGSGNLLGLLLRVDYGSGCSVSGPLGFELDSLHCPEFDVG